MNFEKIHSLIKKFSGYPTVCMKASYCIYTYLTLKGYKCEILKGNMNIENKEYVHYIIKILGYDFIIDMTISQFYLVISMPQKVTLFQSMSLKQKSI